MGLTRILGIALKLAYNGDQCEEISFAKRFMLFAFEFEKTTCISLSFN